MSSTADIGVIVGRFQVHELHQAHRELIESVMAQHKKVLIMLGVSPVLVSKRNPLDFVARKEMLLTNYSGLTVLSIPDMPSDEEWSRTLDARIREAFPVGDVQLYGSRDSFIQYYSGAFPTQELAPQVFVSGTEVRRNASREVKQSGDFRAGVIYAAFNQYTKVFPTVDVAILRGEEVLLGRKAQQNKYRFIGGFADATDDSYEAAARREVMEETGVEVENLRYLGSARIDDWRYRSEADKIITLFFAADYAYGRIEPKDDISELRFFKLHELDESSLVAEHHVLLHLLKATIAKQQGVQS